jgi:hypothetical protein
MSLILFEKQARSVMLMKQQQLPGASGTHPTKSVVK